MNYPQIVLLLLHFVALLISANKHDKPKEGRYSLWVDLLSVAILYSILILGGWFK